MLPEAASVHVREDIVVSSNIEVVLFRGVATFARSCLGGLHVWAVMSHTRQEKMTSTYRRSKKPTVACSRLQYVSTTSYCLLTTTSQILAMILPCLRRSDGVPAGLDHQVTPRTQAAAPIPIHRTPADYFAQPAAFGEQTAPATVSHSTASIRECNTALLFPFGCSRPQRPGLCIFLRPCVASLERRLIRRGWRWTSLCGNAGCTHVASPSHVK